MISSKSTRLRMLGTTVAAGLALSMATLGSTPAAAQNPVAVSPAETMTLSVGRGSMIRLNSPMTDLFVADPGVADVQVRSSTQLYVFGKGKGETTVYATDRSGRVVYSTNVRVGNNISTVDDILRLAMPEAQIEATPMNGIMLLTGTVGSPGDVEEATRIVKAYVGEGTEVIARLRTATPLQVMLKVKIAEVSRSLVKDIGVNFLSNSSNSNGFVFGAAQGTGINTTTGAITVPAVGTVLRASGRLLGVDILSTLNLAENDGLVTTLAEPSLTALSGETASFLAGGEFPIPVSQGLGNVTVDYKQYGVSLAFTPYVLADGRISMRVRPEVSELSTEGSVRLNGFTVPATTTRRAETTVELGSGQSFMIAGLMRNSNSNAINKAPFLGDLPIIGALFRSTGFRKAETELVIIVTPYLVKPVSGRLALPSDGYREQNDAQRFLAIPGRNGVSGAREPRPTLAPPRTVVGRGAALPAPRVGAKTSASPGFNF